MLKKVTAILAVSIMLTAYLSQTAHAGEMEILVNKLVEKRCFNVSRRAGTYCSGKRGGRQGKGRDQAAKHPAKRSGMDAEDKSFGRYTGQGPG